MARKLKMSDDGGFVLPEGFASSSEPQNFPGFPGLWTEGEPIALSDLGVEDGNAAEALVAAMGLPFEVAADVEPRGFDVIHGYDKSDYSVPPPGGGAFVEAETGSAAADEAEAGTASEGGDTAASADAASSGEGK